MSVLQKVWEVFLCRLCTGEIPRLKSVASMGRGHENGACSMGVVDVIKCAAWMSVKTMQLLWDAISYYQLPVRSNRTLRSCFRTNRAADGHAICRNALWLPAPQKTKKLNQLFLWTGGERDLGGDAFPEDVGQAGGSEGEWLDSGEGGDDDGDGGGFWGTIQDVWDSTTGS